MCKQSEDGKMLATVWKDSSLVFNLTICHKPTAESISRKIRGPQGWQSVNLNATEGIVAYNKYMGGVDHHDHLRANYTIQRPGHRWWRYFVWFLIDVSLVNSYILFKMCRKSAISHKQFRLTVAKQLVGGYSMRSHRTGQKEITELDRTLAQHHTRTVFPGRPRACRLCSKRKLKTRAGRAKKTSDGCAECQIYLHKDCF
ncbi:PiggyBac transposable element-derived protein 4-like [Plakobranchus ocellatus]|uniref:PiggyBac transposable element-derived protein 4-like n=1 Tax=Plakobranchus ocellatus TaxID=259542 RepID=A0AAV4AYZ0_9GAST|nr:PiggyBac transposable element-derived protein 4-like [Plakobranchus ocellatus]